MNQYVVREALWADRKTGKPVRLEPGEISAARLGRHESVSHKLTIPGQIFTEEQVAALGLSDFVEKRSEKVRAEIHAAEEARVAALRKSRVAALRAELAQLEEEEEGSK